MDTHIRLARPNEIHRLAAIDNAASELYANAGLNIELAVDHPFVLEETRRWRLAIARQHAYVAVDRDNKPVGFIALGWVDNTPYLDQLSVHPHHMRKGIGAALLATAIQWSNERDLWLTTYDHLPWNRNYYERFGFQVVPEHHCGQEVLAVLQAQRAVLPEPDRRTAMRRVARATPLETR